MRTPSVTWAMGCAALLVSSASCHKPAPPPASPADSGSASPSVTVLVTGHEAGELVAKAPRLLAAWKRDERWPEPVLLSTGDAFAGAAISSHFQGASTAEVMKLLGYKALTLGNHELDLGFETLARFIEDAGVTLLAANLAPKLGGRPIVRTQPFTVLERQGVKLGVVGLTGEKTVKTTVWGRAAELELSPLDEALPAALAGARAAGAQAVVVLVDDCLASLAATLEKHPEWKVDLVVGTRCPGAADATVRGVPFLTVGESLSSYVSATFTVSPGGALSLRAGRMQVSAGDEDAQMRAVADRWQKKLDDALGQRIGFSVKGIDAASPALGKWVASVLRERTKADAAYVNRRGLRAGVPPGPITRATVATMLPFENALLLAKVPGSALLRLKASPEAVFDGPAAIDPKAEYRVATTEYLYFGGDGLGLDDIAPLPEPNGQMWQTPVIEWLIEKQTNQQKPLEGLLDAR